MIRERHDITDIEPGTQGLIYFKKTELEEVISVKDEHNAKIGNRSGTPMPLSKLQRGDLDIHVEGYVDQRDKDGFGDIVIENIYAEFPDQIELGQSKDNRQAMAELFNVSVGGGTRKIVCEDPLIVKLHFD